MKMYEALSMLCAARDGQIPKKLTAVQKYGEQCKRILREMGLKYREINSQYPNELLADGLFLITNHPTEFAKQARAAGAWLIKRN